MSVAAVECLHAAPASLVPGLCSRSGAGTNDMGHEKRETISSQLAQLHALALAHGAQTIAIAIPHHGQEPKLKWLEAKRTGCNEDLKALAAKSGGKVSFFDLAAKIPMFGISEAEREKHWDE